MAFTVGQWNLYPGADATTSLDAALFRFPTVPADPYKTLLKGFPGARDAVPGTTMRQAERTTTSGANTLWAYAQGGCYDTDREVFVATGATGHFAGGSDEVVELNTATGRWTQVMEPTVELWAMQDAPWPAPLAYGAQNFTGVEAFLDVNNRYAANVVNSTGNTTRGIAPGPYYPSTGQQYGCVTYIPAPYRLFWASGGVSAFDQAYGQRVPRTYDVINKKWQLQDAEYPGNPAWPTGASSFPGGACWDSTYNRVLFHDQNSIFAYNPAAAPGSRVSQVGVPDTGGDYNDETTVLWDPPRKRLVLFGGHVPSQPLVRVYDFSAGPTNPTRTNF